MTDNSKAAVLFSGGQDSTTCLAWALDRYAEVEAVGFDYGQRHRVEMEQAERIAVRLGVTYTRVPIPALRLAGAASLTSDDIPSAVNARGTGNTYAEEHGLPSSFVPGRNAVLLATAVAVMVPRGCWTLVTGVCEADDAGYPDCRGAFVDHMEEALRSALDDSRLTIETPLLMLDKARTFAMARDLGVLDVVLELSHTCYEGDRSVRHDWGYGCGECPACQTRAAGWATFSAAAT